MKKSNIAFLFQKHEAKKVATCAPPIPAVDEELSIPVVEDPLIVSDESAIVVVDEGTETPRVTDTDTDPTGDNGSDEVEEEEEEPPTAADVDSLEHDPGLRSPISTFDVNEQDSIRRRYILKGPCHLYAYNYPSRKIYGKDRRFNFVWFHKYHWIEYSVEKDAAYCFYCYLFGKESGKFITDGWHNWNMGTISLDKHESSTLHKFAQEKYSLFVKKGTKIDTVIEKVSEKDRVDYKARLTYSLRCLRFLLHQGLACRGHDETEESNNRGNFLELLNWLAGNNEEVHKVVLKNAPGNCILTSPRIQKQIIRCCSEETTRYILEELGDDYYAILADECSDISHKEQLAVCLRYVDKRGSVCERFLGVVHVPGTTSLELKTAIQSLLTSHHLSLSSCRGQGYDGASNMKGEVKGLKTLIMKESPSAYYVHCFAHQLQLVLVAVAKGDVGASTFFAQVSRLLNIVGVSCKRHDMLRDVRAQKLKKALELGEIESGSGLNQEMGLARPGDTRWGSHYRTVLHIIDMYSTIREVLITLGKDPTQRDDWPNIHAMVLTLESFEFVFNAHLMLVILGYTNELSQSLQKRDQDIVNAMALVGVAKRRFQQLRSDGWDGFLEKVKSFCIEYSIDVPAMDSKYEPHGRSHRFYPVQTIDDHYRREVYIGIIDRIHQELENRFDEVSRELLICMSALNPSNSFVSFDAQKILKLATFYPKDFSSSALRTLEIQLGTYIEDVRMDDRFEGLNNLGELSNKLVDTKKHELYGLVY